MRCAEPLQGKAASSFFKVEIKGDVEVQGKVKVRDDVIAQTVSLVGHKHTDSRSGNTSAPLP